MNFKNVLHYVKERLSCENHHELVFGVSYINVYKRDSKSEISHHQILK